MRGRPEPQCTSPRREATAPMVTSRLGTTVHSLPTPAAAPPVHTLWCRVVPSSCVLAHEPWRGWLHGGMGRAGPPGAAEHITTARGDRTDGHFDLVHSLRQRPARPRPPPVLPKCTEQLCARSRALERVAPGGMGRAGPPGAAEHITTARGDRTDRHFDLVHHSLRQRPARPRPPPVLPKCTEQLCARS